MRFAHRSSPERRLLGGVAPPFHGELHFVQFEVPEFVADVGVPRDVRVQLEPSGQSIGVVTDHRGVEQLGAEVVLLVPSVHGEQELIEAGHGAVVQEGCGRPVPLRGRAL